MSVYQVTAHRAYTCYVKMRLTASGLPGTGLTPTAQISKNGAALGGIGGSVAELGATGVYKIVLSTADTNTVGGAVIHVIEATCFDEIVELEVKGYPDFTVAAVSDAGPASSAFITDLTEAGEGYWADCDLIFLTGNLSQQRKRVSRYDGAEKKVYLSGSFSTAPANGDKFCLVNH